VNIGSVVSDLAPPAAGRCDQQVVAAGPTTVFGYQETRVQQESDEVESQDKQPEGPADTWGNPVAKGEHFAEDKKFVKNRGLDWETSFRGPRNN